MDKNTVIIDGNNILHRAHWISANNLSNPGMQMHIFLNMLKKVIVDNNVNIIKKENTAPEIVVVWDRKLEYPSTNFRTQYEEYKGNRDQVRNNDALVNVEKIIKIISHLGIPSFFPLRLEADDVISWLSQKLPRSTIISADQDMYQLVSDKVTVFNFNKKVYLTPENFEHHTGCPDTETFIYYKCIKGDPSDNLLGIEGYGIKKSTALAKIRDFSNLTEEERSIIDKNLLLMDIRESWNKEKGEKQCYADQYNKIFENPTTFHYKDLIESFKENDLHQQIKDKVWSKFNLSNVLNNL